MNFCIDIDGTICETHDSDYPNSTPIHEAIEEVNRLYDAGNYIKIFTGRGSRSGKDWKEFTKVQLKKWDVKYHELIFGKPSCEFIVDDKAISLSDWKLGFDKRVDLLSEMIAEMSVGNKVLIAGR